MCFWREHPSFLQPPSRCRRGITPLRNWGQRRQVLATTEFNLQFYWRSSPQQLSEIRPDPSHRSQGERSNWVPVPPTTNKPNLGTALNIISPKSIANSMKPLRGPVITDSTLRTLWSLSPRWRSVARRKRAVLFLVRGRRGRTSTSRRDCDSKKDHQLTFSKKRKD